MVGVAVQSSLGVPPAPKSSMAAPMGGVLVNIDTLQNIYPQDGSIFPKEKGWGAYLTGRGSQSHSSRSLESQRSGGSKNRNQFSSEQFSGHSPGMGFQDGPDSASVHLNQMERNPNGNSNSAVHRGGAHGVTTKSTANPAGTKQAIAPFLNEGDGGDGKGMLAASFGSSNLEIERQVSVRERCQSDTGLILPAIRLQVPDPDCAAMHHRHSIDSETSDKVRRGFCGIGEGGSGHHNHAPESSDDEDGRSSHAMASCHVGSPSARTSEHGVPAHLHHLAISMKANRFLWVRKLCLLAIMFGTSLSFVLALFLSFPKIETLATRQSVTQGVPTNLVLKVPTNLEELRAVRETLDLYRHSYSRQVEAGIVVVYLFLQTFMIPGCIFLNLLAGSLFGFYKALFLAMLLSTVGSSMSFILSQHILKEIIYQMFPDRIDRLCRQVQHHRHSLLNYILFMRITPIFPNWFTNVSAPIVGMPFHTFFLGTLFGLIPSHVISVKAGRVLGKIKRLGELYDWWTITALLIIGIVVLFPVCVKTKKKGERARAPDILKKI